MERITIIKTLHGNNIPIAPATFESIYDYKQAEKKALIRQQQRSSIIGILDFFSSSSFSPFHVRSSEEKTAR